MIQEPVEEEKKEEVVKAEGEDDEEAAPEENNEDGEKAAPKWKPTDYKWTITNGKSKNLPQLFRDYMGNRCNFEEKNWKTYQATSHGDAAVKALDEFCEKIAEANDDRPIAMYQQVIFNDQD